MAHSLNQRWAAYRNAALSNTPILVRSGPTDVYGYTINNPNAAEEFFLMFDAADVSDITLGTTVPSEPIKLPISGAIVETPHEQPIASFSRGLVIAATTTEDGNTAPGSAISVTVRYS